MEPFEKEAALFWVGFITLGPQGRNMFRLAGREGAVNFVQGGLGFLLQPFHFKRVEEVIT